MPTPVLQPALEQVFVEEFDKFKRQSDAEGRFKPVDWEERYPCLEDRTSETRFDRHYIYHPAWAARVLARTRPEHHVDVSSTIQFASIVSAFVPTSFYDYRPAPLVLSGLTVGRADLLKLPFETGAIESLSCMHVIEHIGLGRYGDPIDSQGDIKAVSELIRVLKPGGSLLVAVPVGNARVQFNAHRVYNHQDFIALFKGMTLSEFALIPDGDAPNGLVMNARPQVIDKQTYGCGCYWFTKS